MKFPLNSRTNSAYGIVLCTNALMFWCASLIVMPEEALVDELLPSSSSSDDS